MNNPLNFSPSELLSVWLDGELDAVHEAKLFSQLAASAELRQEMRDLLAIHQEIDAAKFYPPAHLKTAALGKAGLGEKFFLGDFFSSALPAVKSILAPAGLMALGSALTIAFMALWNDAPTKENFAGKNSAQTAENKFSLNEKSTGNSEEKISSESKSPFGNQSVADWKKSAIQENFAQFKNSRATENSFSNPEKKISSDEKYNQSEEDFSEQTFTEIGRIFPSENSFSNKISLSSQALVNGGFSQEKISSLPVENFLFSEKKSFLSDVALSVRGMVMNSYPAPITKAQADPFFDEMAAGIFYNFSENQKIGIEFGQEKFSQDYYGTEQTFDGEILFHYKQNLLLPWAGLSYEVTPQVLSVDFLRPLGRATIGASDAGMVTRLIGGFEFTPDRRTKFLLALDWATLMYSHQSQIFSAPKFGITYGVSVGF